MKIHKQDLEKNFLNKYKNLEEQNESLKKAIVKDNKKHQKTNK